MWLGLNGGEWALTGFIFLVVYAASFAGKLGELVARALSRGDAQG